MTQRERDRAAHRACDQQAADESRATGTDGKGDPIPVPRDGVGDRRHDHRESHCHDEDADDEQDGSERSEEHTSELQSLMRISYAVFCLKKKKQNKKHKTYIVSSNI